MEYTNSVVGNDATRTQLEPGNVCLRDHQSLMDSNFLQQTVPNNNVKTPSCSELHLHKAPTEPYFVNLLESTTILHGDCTL